MNQLVKTICKTLLVAVVAVGFLYLGWVFLDLLESKTKLSEQKTKHNIHVFNMAEAVYSAGHSEYGSISELAEAKLINQKLCASDGCELGDYTFTITVYPHNYRLVAVPNDSRQPVFCSNISGVVRTNCYTDNYIPRSTYN